MAKTVSCLHALLNYSVIRIILAIAFCAATAQAESQPGHKGLSTANRTKPAHAASSSGHEMQVTLDSGITIFVDPGESEPVQRAVADLTSDFEKVFGRHPKVVSRSDNVRPVTIFVAEQSNLPPQMRSRAVGAPESFSISVQAADWSPAPPGHAVVLSGADTRGTIYAVYEFSQRYLGIDPLYYWTDHQPAKRASIQIPATLHEDYPAPLFKYRGFFINDEDLLTGWASGEMKDRTGISVAVWDKIYETVLRLKGNMVAPGTWIFPDEPQAKFAAKRGLIVTQHHAIPLALNVARWPKDVPYNYSEHPEILERAWKNAVNSYLPDQEVLWSVGLRGLSDVSYASMDPSVRDNNKALGGVDHESRCRPDSDRTSRAAERAVRD
jgi:hypothetical protein